MLCDLLLPHEHNLVKQQSSFRVFNFYIWIAKTLKQQNLCMHFLLTQPKVFPSHFISDFITYNFFFSRKEDSICKGLKWKVWIFKRVLYSIKCLFIFLNTLIASNRKWFHWTWPFHSYCCKITSAGPSASFEICNF